MELSALNQGMQRLFSGCIQKLMNLLSRYTTLLMSRPKRFKSLTYSSRLLSASYIWLQFYCVIMCFIFFVGSMSPITNSTQLLTPVEKMTGSHYSLRYARKLSKFFLLQIFSRHSYSSNHRWKSSFLLGDIIQPSSSGIKVKESTSSISMTTVSFWGCCDGGNNFGLFLLASKTASTKYRLLIGFSMTLIFSFLSFLLMLNKPRITLPLSTFLIITQIQISQTEIQQCNHTIMDPKYYHHQLSSKAMRIKFIDFNSMDLIQGQNLYEKFRLFY